MTDANEIPTDNKSESRTFSEASTTQSRMSASGGSLSTRSEIASSQGSFMRPEGSGRPSWKSLGSQITANLVNEYLMEPQEAQQPSNKLDSMDGPTLIATVRDKEKHLKRVRVENGVFERFLRTNDPQALEDMADVLAPRRHHGDRMSMSSKRASLFSKSVVGSRKGSKMSVVKIVSTVMRLQEKEPPKISINQKSDMVLKDMEEKERVHQLFKKKSHRIKSNLVARIEEMETREEEIKKSIDDFDQFKLCGEPMNLERYARFMNEWSKRSRLMADKIRLRYSSFKVQYQKLSVVLAHKQLIGENLQEIDFEQLRIENIHLVEFIEKKTHLLIELKKMTGEGNLKLSQHKKILQQKVIEKQNITQAVKRIEKDISKSDDEIMKLYAEIDESKKEHLKVKEKFQQYKVPDIILYVKKKAEVHTLKKDLKVWGRRRIIKDVALTIEIGEMKKLLHCAKPHPSWFD